MSNSPSNEQVTPFSSNGEHPFSKNSPLCLDGQIKLLSDHIIAGGGFSNVYLGELQLEGQKRSVAIKVIRAFDLHKNPKAAEKLIQRTWREFSAWSALSHPNIMEFLGFSYDFVPSPLLPAPSLISPWMENGTLSSYIEQNPDVERLPLIFNIAQGLSYLHSQSPVVVHGDLRGGNILIGDDGVPRLTDFGLSRRIGDTLNLTTTAHLAGSLRWMAPEQFFGKKVTAASDVWMYGMTVLEILTGSPPYNHLQIDPEVIASICKREIPLRPDLQNFPQYSEITWNVCTRCWAFEPEQRISMKVIEEVLRNISLGIDLLRTSQTVSVSTTPNNINDGDGSPISVKNAQQLPGVFPSPSLANTVTYQAPVASADTSSGITNSASDPISDPHKSKYEENELYFPSVIKEEEEVNFKIRAKLFRFDSEANEWKEGGTGEVRLLEHKEHKTVRLVMRQDKTRKVCANHLITHGMELQSHLASDRSWVYKCPEDLTDGISSSKTLAIRFANATNANLFKEAFEKAQASNIAILAKEKEKY